MQLKQKFALQRFFVLKPRPRVIPQAFLLTQCLILFALFSLISPSAFFSSFGTRAFSELSCLSYFSMFSCVFSHRSLFEKLLLCQGKKYFPKLPPSNYIMKNPAKMLPSKPPKKKHINTPEEFHSHSLPDNFLFIPFMVLKATLYILAGNK